MTRLTDAHGIQRRDVRPAAYCIASGVTRSFRCIWKRWSGRQKRPAGAWALNRFPTGWKFRATAPGAGRNGTTDRTTEGVTVKQKRKKILGVIFSAVLTVAVSAAVALNVDWAAFAVALREMNVWTILAALATCVLARTAYTAKWHLVSPGLRFTDQLRAMGESLPLLLLPSGGFFADASRIAYFRKREESYIAASSVVIDRLTMPLSVLCFALPLMAIGGDVNFSAAVYLGLGVVAAGTILIVAVLLHPRWCAAALSKLRALKKWKLGAKLYGVLERTQEAMHAMGLSPRRVICSVLTGLLGDVLMGLVYFWFGWRLGIHITPIKWLWVYALPSIATTVVSTAGGLGVREATIVAFLGVQGIDSGRSITLSLLYTGTIIVTALLGAAAAMIAGRLEKRRKGTGEEETETDSSPVAESEQA